MLTGIPAAKTLCRFLIRKLSVLFIGVVIFCPQINSEAFAANLGLIEPSELKRNPSAWVILDSRPKSEWTSGHIPGAISFSWEDYTRTDENGVPYSIYPASTLAKALGEMGINEKTAIVVYGDAEKSWGGEGWTCWVLSWLGHKGPIRLLAGGIQSWRINKFPVAAGDEKRDGKTVRYAFELEPSIDISTEEIAKNKSSFVLVDTRSTLEWFKGRIPGAIHIPWEKFHTGKERRPLSPVELRKLLEKKGVDTRKTIIYYCTGGIRSGYAWLVHQLSGLPTAKNYEGGHEAWQKKYSK